jgi:NAD-dependent dihydropyrimidine dehydrogenase PreA subunit
MTRACQVVDVYMRRLVSVTESFSPKRPRTPRLLTAAHIEQYMEETSVTYTIAEPCVDIKDKACIEECPVDCIYEGARMLYIHPDECVDCGACEPVCPVEAIYYEDDVPDQWSQYTQINADFFAELGSPGGAAKVGMTENDPQVVKDLPPQGEDA